MRVDPSLVTSELKKCIGENATIIGMTSLSGGDINDVYRLATNQGNFCVKLNSESRFPGMFEAEYIGLQKLAATNTIDVAKPIGFGASGGVGFLVLAYIESTQRSPNFWDNFGAQLADLHRQPANKFGADLNNYIGSLQQSNSKHYGWPKFYTEERLRPLAQRAFGEGLLNHSDLKNFEALYLELPSIFPDEPPALLHGDLWNGNYMVNDKGEPVLIDPAVYFGHREMDLGMSLLFGGFDNRFYQVYQTVYPLESNWESRVELCQLYPLLVHLNLFGRGYYNSIRQIIKKF